jgi:nitroreductase
MKKPAPTQFPINELIRDRWSPRAFENKSVSPEILHSLFEAARWAPSSNNEQPWAYIVATQGDKAGYEKLLGTLVEFNASWAKSAPVLAIVVSNLWFSKNDTPNRNAHYDTGAATAMLSVEATAHGVAVHQILLAGRPSRRWQSGMLGIPLRCLRSSRNANLRRERANQSASL